MIILLLCITSNFIQVSGNIIKIFDRGSIHIFIDLLVYSQCHMWYRCHLSCFEIIMLFLMLLFQITSVHTHVFFCLILSYIAVTEHFSHCWTCWCSFLHNSSCFWSITFPQVPLSVTKSSRNQLTCTKKQEKKPKFTAYTQFKVMTKSFGTSSQTDSYSSWDTCMQAALR